MSSRIAVVALSLLLLAAPAAGEPGVPAVSPPRALIQATIDQVLRVLNDPQLSSGDRRERLEQIAQERFDFETMSRLVVAQYWRRFSPQERQQLVEEFKAFLSRTYGDRIDRYSDESVEVVGERPEGARGDVTVSTRIVGGNYDGAEVDYRLREKGGAWHVIDVKVEGISLVLNYRDQFKAVLSRKGPKGLLEALREKNSDAQVVRAEAPPA